MGHTGCNDFPEHVMSHNLAYFQCRQKGNGSMVKVNENRQLELCVIAPAQNKDKNDESHLQAVQRFKIVILMHPCDPVE